MSDETENQAETIFLRARELDDSGNLETFLDGACGEDSKLREAVDSLLRADGKASDFFDPRLKEEENITAIGELTEQTGSMIGRYKLLEQIGEGGMGVVFMAEQTEPFLKKVALKIIKLGMDTKQVIARFEAERQALALMEHPNIAKVIDGGATMEGRPYFVMELVRGIPITEYCDKQKLSTRERLELFIPVCQAIQHAHQKGIIHRDLKPSNVLVTLNDGVPHPMVIDFGIAKATNQKLTEKTLFTNFSQMIGTPAYMSPEQAEMSRLDVDTRSDIYSLGVMLYELLTDTTPLPEKTLRSAGWAEMQRMISEEEPDKPSVRMSTLTAEQQTSLRKGRREDPGRIKLLLRRELDWIVMKCLEKDRNRRYATANGLAMDIRRYLDGGSPEAAPPTLSYQLGKMARRYRRTVATLGAIGVILLIASIVSLTLATRAVRAERAAQEERNTAIAINDYFREQIIEGSDPWSPNTEPAAALSLGEVLLRASSELDGRFAGQPQIEATIRLSLGQALQSQGNPADAVESFGRAAALFEEEFGDDDVRTIEGRLRQGMARVLVGGDRGNVERQLRSAYEKLYATQSLTNELTVTALSFLSLHYANNADYEQFEALKVPVMIERAEAIHGRGSLAVSHLKQSLAAYRKIQYRHADARTIYGELLDIERHERKKRGTDAPPSIREANLLQEIGAYQFKWDGNPDEAINTLREALEITERQAGDGFPALNIHDELLNISLATGDYRAAYQWGERGFEIAYRRWSPKELKYSHPRLQESALRWSDVPMIEGRWNDALALLREIRNRGVRFGSLLSREILLAELLESPGVEIDLVQVLLDSVDSSAKRGRLSDVGITLAVVPVRPEQLDRLTRLISSEADQLDGGYGTVNAYILRGLLAIQQGEYQQAIDQLEFAALGTETPELTCLALYQSAVGHHRLGSIRQSKETLAEGDELYRSLTVPGVMAYWRKEGSLVVDHLPTICEYSRRRAHALIWPDSPIRESSPEEQIIKRVQWKPLGDLLVRYDLHQRRDETEQEYQVLRAVLGHPKYDFNSARVAYPGGPRNFCATVMRTLTRVGDTNRFRKFASEYLATLDPRLQEFSSRWAMNLDWMPDQIKDRVIAATPYWAEGSISIPNWGLFDLSWALYAQEKFGEAYVMCQKAHVDTDLSGVTKYFSTHLDLLAVRITSKLNRFDEASNHVAKIEAVIKNSRPWEFVSSAPGFDVKEVSNQLAEAKSLMARLQAETGRSGGSNRTDHVLPE